MESDDGNLIGQGGRIRVDRTVFGVMESETRDIEIQKFQTHPAYVRVGYGLTLNLGNYEAARLDVSVSVPCYQEEIPIVYANVRNRVEELIIAEKEAIQSKTAQVQSGPRSDRS